MLEKNFSKSLCNTNDKIKKDHDVFLNQGSPVLGSVVLSSGAAAGSAVYKVDLVSSNANYLLMFLLLMFSG